MEINIYSFCETNRIGMMYDFCRILYFFVQVGTCLRLMEECFSVSPLFFLSFLFPLSRFLYTALLQILSSFFLSFIRDEKSGNCKQSWCTRKGLPSFITKLPSFFYLLSVDNPTKRVHVLSRFFRFTNLSYRLNSLIIIY